MQNYCAVLSVGFESDAGVLLAQRLGRYAVADTFH